MISSSRKVSLFFYFFFFTLLGCSKPTSQAPAVMVPDQRTGPSISAGSIPSDGRVVTLGDQSKIFLQVRDGVPYYNVEGTFSADSFAQIHARSQLRPSRERAAIFAGEIKQVFDQLKTIGGVGLHQIPEVGYFSFEVPYPLNQTDFMAPLRKVHFSHSILVAPVRYEAHTQGQEPRSFPHLPQSDRSDYNGFESMHVSEFVRRAQADIGEHSEVNGSTVRVGVADTGITLNHPTFLAQDEVHSRIVYLKDFTGEGRVYFNKSAKFEVSSDSLAALAAKDTLLVTAEVILTPKLPQLPSGDSLYTHKNWAIRVSPELKAILTRVGSGAKLGFLNKNAFQSPREQVDVNGDGNVDNFLPMILIPGATPAEDVVYLDTSGTGDFRNSQPLGDWNKTKASAVALSERFGFDFNNDWLPSANGKGPIEVRSVSIVGFDPGDHGTHVSGIIAGRRNIQNDVSNKSHGVAPAASLLVNRACSNNGGCASFTEAFIDLAVRGKVDVVNLSLGGSSLLNDSSALEAAIVDRLTEQFGVLFVTAAGNSGPGRQTVGVPSTARFALSVGATANRNMIQSQYQWGGLTHPTATQPDEGDFMLFFSSRGPTAAGGFKPNVTAPGTQLSSVRLNSAPGTRGGLDVMWGTSMAAPAATGAYALFLDAVRKYNLYHPQMPLETDVLKLREVLIQSARPFALDEYTWIDEGQGMVDLVAAWNKLFELRDSALASAVQLNGKSIDLDYQVLVSMKSPVGIPYNGTVLGQHRLPSFGEGLYLDYSNLETKESVSILRRISSKYMTDEVVMAARGELLTQLKTTQDEFVLKTTFYGSPLRWLKAGTLDQTECLQSESGKVVLIGESAVIQPAVPGKPGDHAIMNSLPASNLNVCLDRAMILNQLKPGDHGALIHAYRVVHGREAVLPSFTVPVYLTVPHQQLKNSTAYLVENGVGSFAVKRNYVTIPEGATHVRVTLDVPYLARTSNGEIAPNASCSGVEIFPLAGTNVSQPLSDSHPQAVSNCDSSGRPREDEAFRTLSFTVLNPKPGIWDLPVLGLYNFAQSHYRLRVDYIVATSPTHAIIGGIPALNGSLQLMMKEASFEIAPDVMTSSFELESLVSVTPARALLPTVFRSYPRGVKAVGMSLPGAGDLARFTVLQCPIGVTAASDPQCVPVEDYPDSDSDMIGAILFSPNTEFKYSVRVEQKDPTVPLEVELKEVLHLEIEKGQLAISSGSHGIFDIGYEWNPLQIQSSVILSSPFFLSGAYSAEGTLVLRAKDNTVLLGFPVEIRNIQNPFGMSDL